MGLFSIRGENLDDIQAQIYYVDMHRRSEQTRVLSRPGFYSRYRSVLESTDSIVEVFELNKKVADRAGVIPTNQPGIVARMPDANYEVHLPIKQHALDIGSIAVHEIKLPDEETDPYKYGPYAGRAAVAMAAQMHVLGIDHEQE